MRREIQIPQAMQRHTGCAWVKPTQPVEQAAEPKHEPAPTGRDIETPAVRPQSES